MSHGALPFARLCSTVTCASSAPHRISTAPLRRTDRARAPPKSARDAERPRQPLVELHDTGGYTNRPANDHGISDRHGAWYVSMTSRRRNQGRKDSLEKYALPRL